MSDLPYAVVLTAEEYESLPPDGRIELVDGVAQVRPTATVRHHIIVDHLLEALQRHRPEELVMVRRQEARLDDLHRRDPDLMAVLATADDLDVRRYAPKDVVLIVEVVDRHTRTVDRLHKPSEYAVAGIEHYWRVEILPSVAVHTYRLADTGRYAASGVFTEGDTVAAPGLPWAKIAVADLAP